MIVLGSTVQPMVNAIRVALGPNDELREFDVGQPLTAQVRDVSVLLLGTFRVSEDVLDAAPRLRLVQQHGRGIDGVDLAAATKRGIVVANVPGGNSVAVAEHALSLMLFMARKLHALKTSIANRILGAPTGIELAGKTLGIVGLGASGRELARRALALGMRVLATKAHPATDTELQLDFVGGPGELPYVLREADLVSLHVPLTDATRGLLGEPELRLMKRSAYLVNVARAGLVDYGALLYALRDGVIAGAAFDVFWSEPADPEDPILALDNFVLTPHVAGFSDQSIVFVSRAVAENTRRLRTGQELLNVVNPEAVSVAGRSGPGDGRVTYCAFGGVEEDKGLMNWYVDPIRIASQRDPLVSPRPAWQHSGDSVGGTGHGR